jgi:hypothetical protein
MRPAAFLAALPLLAVPLAPAAAPPAGGQRTVAYDVADMIHKPGSGKTGYDRIDDVVAALTELFPDAWRPGGKERLEVVGESVLRVSAGPARQAEIADALRALRRMQDVAVDLRADLFEVDRAFYDRVIRPKLRDEAGLEALVVSLSPRDEETPPDNKFLADVQKKVARLGTTKVRIANNRAAPIVGRRQAVTYTARLRGAPGVVFTGVRGLAHVTVSADRRFVRLKLTQESARLVGVEKKRAFDPETEKEGFIEVPDLATETTTATVEVPDGGAALVSVRAGAARGRARFLLVQPRIYIEEEERERARIERKKRP